MTTRDTVRVTLAAALIVSALMGVGLVRTLAQSPSASPTMAPGTTVGVCPSPASSPGPASSPMVLASPEVMAASPAVLASPVAAASPAVATSSAVRASPVLGASPDVVAPPGVISSPTPGACTTVTAVEAEVYDFAFEPAELTVGVGTTVRWTNGGPSVHTVTAKDGSFDSGAIAPGATFEHTFDAVGMYPYFCVPHPNMIGTVIVR